MLAAILAFIEALLSILVGAAKKLIVGTVLFTLAILAMFAGTSIVLVQILN